MSQYLTIDEWENLGGYAQIDEMLFSRLEFKARKMIDRATHGRITEENPVRDAVVYCMYELISAMQADESVSGAYGRDVASMSNDGVSVTFVQGSGAQGGMSARYSGIIHAWLSDEVSESGVSLLYAGVDV